MTALQEAAAVAGIVNGGVYHSPTIIKSAVDGHGEPSEIPKTTTRRVISQRASEEVRDMMENVVSTAKGRPIPDYRMGAKTGTAQRIDLSVTATTGTSRRLLPSLLSRSRVFSRTLSSISPPTGILARRWHSQRRGNSCLLPCRDTVCNRPPTKRARNPWSTSREP
ncbi:cell division protein FtsI [Cutibacterium acnes JCM 18918]|nr:cell division protein FtsI [Cutibacterium acnes JCM 18918]